MLGFYKPHRSPFPLLLVKDDSGHRQLIGHSLTVAIPGARLTFASTVDEAFAHLETLIDQGHPLPRLVFLDWQWAGSEPFLRRLRTEYSSVTVLALSEGVDDHQVRQAYRLGIHAFIRLPADTQIWQSVMDQLCRYWVDVVALADRRNVF